MYTYKYINIYILNNNRQSFKNKLYVFLLYCHYRVYNNDCIIL